MKPKIKRVRAWAWVGSLHEKIIPFAANNTHVKPSLLHVYGEKISRMLTPCILEYKVRRTKK